jgi:DNA polymerase III delta subunit
MIAKKEPGPAAKGGPLAFKAVMARSRWKPLPPAAILSGPADFLKGRFVKRFARELFGEGEPEVRRFQGPASDRQAGDLPLAVVLDELRTPSLFSPHRIIIVERAGPFLAAHGEDLIPFLESGFSGGHLIAIVDGKLDGRTRFAKAAARVAWVVDCPQPYDRPPPWDAKAPVWDSDLTHWVVAHAAEKGLQIDPRTAFLLHERAGTDLAVLDEELDKIATFLAARGATRVDAETVAAIAGDLREDSVFLLADRFLEGRRAEALQAAVRIFEKGIHTERGALTTEPVSIALLFIGALVPRLRALRRAHAAAAEGAGPDRWIEMGLIQRPFLSRFQRELRAVPAGKIARIFDRLYEIDRAIKSGGNAAALIEHFILEHGAAPRQAAAGRA